MTLKETFLNYYFFQVKKDNSNSNLPENRQRYWNAYILVYEALNISSGPNSAITPKKTMSQSYNQHQRLSARKVSSSRTSEPSAARESLSELSNLLEKGEKKGLFANRMPAAIERGIQEENLRFLENRDVFCDGYYEFVLELMKTTISWAERNPGNFSKVAVQAISLGVNFLVNTYFHLKNRQLDVMKGLMKAISNLLRISSDATDWLLGFLTNDSVYLRPYLVECAVKEVRTHFAELVFDAIWYFNFHNGNTEIDHINRIMATLVGLIEKDIPNHCKYSAQFFWLLAKFTEMVRGKKKPLFFFFSALSKNSTIYLYTFKTFQGVVQCQQLFQLNTFSQLTKFLLGVEPDPEEMSSEQLSKQRRRWTSVTAKEFGELHRALAFLIASCDLSEQRTVKGIFYFLLFLLIALSLNIWISLQIK